MIRVRFSSTQAVPSGTALVLTQDQARALRSFTLEMATARPEDQKRVGLEAGTYRLAKSVKFHRGQEVEFLGPLPFQLRGKVEVLSEELEEAPAPSSGQGPGTDPETDSGYGPEIDPDPDPDLDPEFEEDPDPEVDPGGEPDPGSEPEEDLEPEPPKASRGRGGRGRRNKKGS